MLTDEEALPGPLGASRSRDGDRERVPREDRPKMRGSVVGSLGRVPKIRVAVGDHSREETLQVSADARIGVLAQDQRGAGVVEEDHAETPVHLRLPHDPWDLSGDLVGPQPSGIDREAPRGEHPESFL